MVHFLLTWLATAVSLVITSKIVPGFYVATFTAAIVAAAILGLVNAIVRPILVFLTLPLSILTLGLFLLVVNAISLYLVGYLAEGFKLAGFWPAFWGSIVLSLVSGFINNFIPHSKR